MRQKDAERVEAVQELWKIDGIDIHLSLTARACQTLWVGKTCQKAKIAFGQPEVKFRERKDGFDVQDIAAKVLLYVKHAKEMERKTQERIAAEDAHIAHCLKINKDVGDQVKLDPGRSWKCIVSESPYHITTHGAEHFSLEVVGGLSALQAAQVLQAVHNVLGPKGTAPYKREKK